MIRQSQCEFENWTIDDAELRVTLTLDSDLECNLYVTMVSSAMGTIGFKKESRTVQVVRYGDIYIYKVSLYLNASRNKENLLFQTELFAVFCGVIRIENS